MTYVSEYDLPGGNVYNAKNRPKRMSKSTKYGIFFIVILCLGYIMWPKSTTTTKSAESANSLQADSTETPTISGNTKTTTRNTATTTIAASPTETNSPNSSNPQDNSKESVKDKSSAGARSPKDLVTSLTTKNKVVMFFKEPCTTCEDIRHKLKENDVSFLEYKIENTVDGKNLNAYLATTYKKSAIDAFIIINRDAWAGQLEDLETLIKEKQLTSKLNSPPQTTTQPEIQTTTQPATQATAETQPIAQTIT